MGVRGLEHGVCFIEGCDPAPTVNAPDGTTERADSGM
jgi:hypothetical protein